jgi:hypothetical protein
VDEMIDLLNLFNVKRGVESVIGILFPDGFDKPLFLILPDALLGEVYHTRDIIDEVEVSQADPLVFPSGHNLFYKKEVLDSHYQKNLKFQEKRPLEPATCGFLNTRKKRLSWSPKQPRDDANPSGYRQESPYVIKSKNKQAPQADRIPG